MGHSRRDFIKRTSVGSMGLMGGAYLLSEESHGLISEGSSWNPDNSGDYSSIIPIPREAVYKDGFFSLNKETKIVLPSDPGDHDLFLSNFLIRELAEKYGLVLTTVRTDNIRDLENFILMGTFKNPLISQFSQINEIPVSSKSPGEEGYFLLVNKSGVTILGSDKQGSFYGLQSLRQLIDKEKAEKIRYAHIKDWPYKSFRAIRLFVPEPHRIPFFRRFIRDFMAYFKYNRVVIEIEAFMRFDRHPELNAGWIEFSKELRYNNWDYHPKGANGRNMNSAHSASMSGHPILDKEQVADLVDYADKYFIETIPEVPSLSHSYYLLTHHRELAETKDDIYPDSYCPSNPKTYELLFDVMDEYIEVTHPKMILFSHDEWQMPINECALCKGKDYRELFIQDVLKIYNYLKEKGIRGAMWGDHLLENVRSKGYRSKTVHETNYSYQYPGALTPEQVKSKIPKDILIFNWFWNDRYHEEGEENTQQLREWGFEQVYGNFTPIINDWETRSEDILGGAPSAWEPTTEFNMGKDNIFSFIGCSNYLWSSHYKDQSEMIKLVQDKVPIIRRNLRGLRLPGEDNNKVLSLDIDQAFNYGPYNNVSGIPLKFLKTGKILTDKREFNLSPDKKAVMVSNVGNTDPLLPTRSQGITINSEVISFIFLHACAKPADNNHTWMNRYNPEDTANLLGWYKIVYEDNYEISVPVRYGLNIMEWHWGFNPETGKNKFKDPFNVGIGRVCYEGDRVNCSDVSDTDLNFFAYEWVNPRLDIGVKEIYLEGSKNFRNFGGDFQRLIGEVIDTNTIALVALSYVPVQEPGIRSAKPGRQYL